MRAIPAPQHDEYASFYGGYIGRVSGDVLAFMDATHAALHVSLDGLDDARAAARPAPGEWSVKEIIGHLSDTERIFAYRALRFARADVTALPGFDQDAYVPAGDFNARALADLLAEFDAVRAATFALLASLSDEALLRRGPASNNVMSVRAWVYAIAGHEAHHLESLKTVYLL